jgi:acetyl esterase
MHRWVEMATSGQLARRIVLDAGLHALAEVLDLLPRMRERMRSCELIEDIEYASHGGESLRLDILQPKSTGPHPVLVYFHGGGFAIASKRTHRGVAAAYASQGYMVCNVDYRLAPQFPFPAAHEDACAAWSWVCAHAHEYGGDPQRIILAGESAGANLALAVELACFTLRPESYAAPLFAGAVRPVGALLYCGFLQASMPIRYQRDGVSALARRVATDAAVSYLGASANQITAQNALADPLCVVEAMAPGTQLPPIFIAAGLDDPVADDSKRLHVALQRLKLAHSAHYYPGETHAFHMMFWRAQAQQCWRDSFAFLRKHARAVG